MTDAIFNLGLILCAVAGVFTIGCIFDNLLNIFSRHNRMATRTRAGRHYRGK